MKFFVVIAFCCAPAWGQCQPEWSDLNGGSELGIVALAEHDEDGPGPRPSYLFVGGGGLDNFAGIPLKMVARWDGWRARPLGGWEPQNGTAVWELLPFTDGNAPIASGLYAGGEFYKIGDTPANNAAVWDGHTWDALGAGLTSPIQVYAWTACAFDEDGDGPSGPALLVGGQFETAGGIAADALARWDGENWSEVGDGLEDEANVYGLTVFDDGRGPALYVAGSFYYAGGQKAYNIARWDGQTWEPVGGPGSGLDATVRAVCTFDEDGPGPAKPALFACGAFDHWANHPENIFRIARWDGQEWTAVGGWNASGGSTTLAVWKGPDDERENLYMGGYFSTLPDGTKVKSIARWNGQTWREVDFGVWGFGQSNHVSVICPFDEDGDGPNPGGLYVGGLFYNAGDKVAWNVARFGCPLGPQCTADLDKSGALDIFDFLTFLNLFNEADALADCDESGEYDLFDFLCFTNAFNKGC